MGGAGGGSLPPSPDQAPSGTWRESARRAALEVRVKAEAAEPAITKRMLELSGETGATMYGLAYRMKTSESLARKIEAEADATGLSDAVAGTMMSDAVRYTMMQESGDYTATAENALSKLAAEGYSLRQKNFWAPGDPYQGINVAVTSPDGQKFELQFHTPESLAVKDRIHPMYEQFRVSKDNNKRAQLWNEMTELAATIPVPSNVEAIPELKLQTLTVVS